jgi:hypothetical protein
MTRSKNSTTELKFSESNGMVIKVGTWDVGKLHEATVYVSTSVFVVRFVNTFICELIVDILVRCDPLTFPLRWYLIIINFYRHCFVLVDSGDRSHFKIVMIL